MKDDETYGLTEIAIANGMLKACTAFLRLRGMLNIPCLACNDDSKSLEVDPLAPADDDWGLSQGAAQIINQQSMAFRINLVDYKEYPNVEFGEYIKMVFALLYAFCETDLVFISDIRNWLGSVFKHNLADFDIFVQQKF
eukprot:c34535_g1_i1 orf=364-780(+)